MSKAGINRNLSNNAFNAAEQANNPGGANVYATLADLFQQDGLIDGSAVWSGSGFTYDVTNLLYRIGGVLYTSTATQVTLTAADPTNGRRDLIVVNTAQVVSVKTGVPAPAPVAPALDVDEVLVAEIFIGAGTTAPVITIEALYDENAGSPTEWIGTSDDLNVTFASVADPNTGTVSIETTSPLGSNKYIQLAKGSPYTIVSGSLQFYIKAKQAMSTPSGQLNIGFYVGGSLVGNSVYIGGSPTNIYGFDPTNTSTYQLVSIPITAFGVLPATVDAIRFFKGPGSTTAEFFLDGVEIQEGAVAPPVAPSLPSLTNGYIWVGDASNNAVETLLPTGTVDGSGTTNYIPKWTPDGDTLGDSPLQVGGAGFNLGHGGTPLGLTMYYINSAPLVGLAGLQTGIDTRMTIPTAITNRGIKADCNNAIARNTGFEAIVGTGASTPVNVGADFAAGSAGSCPIPGNDNDAVGFRVIGMLADADGNNLGPALGAYLCNIQSNAFDNVGLMVNVANAGAGGAYIGLLKDGNEGVGKVLTSDANGYASWQTPAGGGGSGKYFRNLWMFNVATAANYTWNGVSIAAPTAAITSTAHPHRLYNCSGTNNQHQGIYFEQELPSTYTAGANLKVTLNVTALTATGGAVFYVGLTEPTAANVLGGTTETQWIAQTANFTGVTGYHVISLTYTFSGTTITPGDSLLFRVYRDPNDAADNLGTVGMVSISIEEL